MSSGETLRDRPFGSARANGPWGLALGIPFTIGTPNNGGGVVTAGGLLFIAATTDNLIRAIDVETGETVWTDVLLAASSRDDLLPGRPPVCRGYGSGHHFMKTPVSDAIVAYALP